MNTSLLPSFSCFDGHRLLGSGPLATVALLTKRALERGVAGPVLIFDNRTGRSIDVDTRGSDEELIGRLGAETTSTDGPLDTGATPVSANMDTTQTGDVPRGRGRPKLGVVAREVTLLPRHWEWLAVQPGGASIALRKLVEDARRSSSGKEKTRKAHERAYHFMSAIAGDLPGFEEATRSLFANNRDAFCTQIANWPVDVSRHALQLAFDSADIE